MKKVIYAIAILAVSALAITSCKKGDDPSANKKRLVMCGDEWDKYYFFYNADGSIKEVKRNFDETAQTWEKTWTVTWNGNKATVKFVDGTEEFELPFTLGGNGYVSEFTDVYGETRKISYDLAGHLLKVIKIEDGQPIDKCNCVWGADGNLSKWSRFPDGIEEYKIQTFLADENVGGIFPDATDKAGIDRWMFEIGLFGKASKNLLDEAAWENSEAIATHTYTKDADGYVTKVEKFYDGELDQTYVYQWELK